MRQPTVLVSQGIASERVDRIRGAFPELDIRHMENREAALEAAPEAEIIFAHGFPSEALRAATSLRWLHSGPAGVDGLIRILDEENRADVLLTNGSGAYGPPIAELILGMMLTFRGGLHIALRQQRAHLWDGQPVREQRFELAGQNLLVVGLGDIGANLAWRARALGMTVWGVRRSGASLEGVDAIYRPEQLLEALPLADHVALCLPNTAETTAFIGERELRAMRPSAFIYNVGRGRALVTDALVQALSEGWIAGAGLDVTDPEPLPADSPLWQMPNVIITPHIGGGTPEASDRRVEIFIDNLGRYLRGETLRNVVDRSAGY